MDTKDKPALSRRDFLKTTGAASAATLLGTGAVRRTGPAVRSAGRARGRGARGRPGRVVYTLCRQCVLPPCGTKVHVKKRVAVKVEGNAASPRSQGQLCVRGTPRSPASTIRTG